jgi:hypothetical protein
VLSEYAERLDAALIQKMDSALHKAVVGALARGLSTSYTNIALMHAFMLCFAGKRFAEPAWIEAGERMGRDVYHLFKQHNVFAEYNSPTYYGVDLYALALWRSYPALSPLLAQLGSEMEATLWRDVAQFYHADLRNLAGPYDRSYGMNMLDYVSALGIWLRLATDKTLAPFPSMDHPFAHEHDFGFVPPLAFLGVQIPADAREHFAAFRGERVVERVLADSPRRVASAWLGQERMLGGEFTSQTAPTSHQFHPATIHWRVNAEQIGWVRALYLEPIDARASQERLELSTARELAFRVHAPNARVENITRAEWRLPGLTVRVETTAEAFHVQPRQDFFEIHYAAKANQSITCELMTRSPYVP